LIVLIIFEAIKIKLGPKNVKEQTTFCPKIRELHPLVVIPLSNLK
jgi:hypothetical protein